MLAQTHLFKSKTNFNYKPEHMNNPLIKIQKTLQQTHFLKPKPIPMINPIPKNTQSFMTKPLSQTKIRTQNQIQNRDFFPLLTQIPIHPPKILVRLLVMLQLSLTQCWVTAS